MEHRHEQVEDTAGADDERADDDEWADEDERAEGDERVDEDEWVDEDKRVDNKDKRVGNKDKRVDNEDKQQRTSMSRVGGWLQEANHRLPIHLLLLSCLALSLSCGRLQDNQDSEMMPTRIQTRWRRQQEVNMNTTGPTTR
ncbi:hypothetical protein NLJ89_g11623 [Agrocybe chaxingu]|uniref:Uncharacterized protein n=1 Tax=Agrocybe chaxingu TaxID=84603 RepID=A0A9W8MMV5_9AGAR|nr:hypothetical protein NLJ89_g11623 [Agrocybe chaxingu]